MDRLSRTEKTSRISHHVCPRKAVLYSSIAHARWISVWWFGAMSYIHSQSLSVGYYPCPSLYRLGRLERWNEPDRIWQQRREHLARLFSSHATLGVCAP